MTVAASALAARALREHLLKTLPAQVATANALRAATLTSSVVGPFTIPSGAVLQVSLTGDAPFTSVALTSGSRTTAQLVTEINVALGSTVASALSDDRLRLMSTTTPTGPDTTSIIALAEDTTGANSALGFDPGGEIVSRAPLVTPTNKGVCDGEPLVLEPLAQGRMLVVIRDREDVSIDSGHRREERLAQMEVLVYVPMMRQDWHQSREEVQAAVECVTDVLSTTAGRQLGRTVENDIGFVQVKSVKVSGNSWELKKLNLLCDIARMTITARVFQRASL